MFICIGILLAIVLAAVAHKTIAMKMLPVYYEAEVLLHNGRKCTYSDYWGHDYINYKDPLWERATQEEKESKIHKCSKGRAFSQSKHWVRTELSDWFDRTVTKSEERKEARINNAIDPLRDKMREAVEDKLRVEAIVSELRNEPELTEQQKFDKVFAHFVDTAEEEKYLTIRAHPTRLEV